MGEGTWILLVDGKQKLFVDQDGGAQASMTGIATINLKLSEGQLVQVQSDQSPTVYAKSANGAVTSSWFSGFLLFPL